MDRRKKYESLLYRMRLQQNSIKYEKLNGANDLCREDELIKMHLKHIQEYLDILDDRNDALIELSCDAAIRQVQELLDRYGWA